ncbi:Glucose-6-phosphate 1-dehydrogenase [Ceratobasidium sp. 428]|nr:Glucose-6-phosphate 1-dehydrogenase [Ceratobasidium sp. 428]
MPRLSRPFARWALAGILFGLLVATFGSQYHKLLRRSTHTPDMSQRVHSGSIPSMEASHQELKNNTIIIVLGASGDLAKKKTFPALFGLYKIGYLPEGVHIVGYARTKMTPEDFHKRGVSYVKGAEDPEVAKKLEEFKSIMSYVSGSYDGDDGYGALRSALEEIESKYQTKEINRLFYMALPPSVFIPVAQGLRKNCYSPNGTNRIIVEKPFGKDSESCREMMTALKKEWTEDETFRIDHYLGKEMVKNILVLRFANVVFSSGWNSQSIKSVQITFKEPFGTEGRGGYFDEFGIIRDIQQNHLLQVLSILTMERPVSFSAEDIRDEKVKVLRAIPEIKQEDVLLGQYVAANGKPGYLDDETVPQNSVCPTFAALTLWINNPRWEGVPFILKAGKALNEAKVEIRIQYRDVTQGIFKDISRNELVLRIQPSEAVYVKINAKMPGLYTRALPTEMDLTYKRRFTDTKIPEAYEALILDALKGDHSNFVRDDELDVAWKIFTPILHWIEGRKGPAPRPQPYPYGSRGPKELEAFIAKYGYKRADAGYSWPQTALSNL